MRPCLDCNEVLPTRHSRCTNCRRAWEARRNADPKRAGYRRAEYLAQPKDGTCWLCGLPIAFGEGTRDHVTPLAGDFYAVATRPAHRSCNSARGARPGPSGTA